MSRRILALVTVAVLGGAGAAWAGCASNISGSLGGGPLNGSLLGTQDVTEEWEIHLDIGAGFTISGTVSYTVGYYSMSNGQTYAIDCRTYTMA